ncbi:precorrin-6y C5,15-methyltransferase (decarboxylating), CbiE subunit [Rippkaea orientalis PCC 8801]|uniref:tRNA (guanine(46)-N(7))-methyltransferase n=1 Tax=Rippkaea orientalis (strain PCC 8801 / RF-1) TaxID=41431 RepID=B7JUJ0_RIPO1|nr:bifunctional cobalt-precorrin-7 (C(5))-methyltransferase/cobalt-precorrin-6B (C(15))-methyltransferase [Rippkaea orientalis]ACK65534.1 precorrin-6y C5,15-methyltransferase (decarboxylating), CbiE subunit [Rippkaea orientalis PCC 8801]
MINVVGIGLDGVIGLTEKVRLMVEESTVIVGSKRHLSYFPSYLGKKLVLDDFSEAIQAIKNYHKSDIVIVILVSGDPLFFGLGRLLLEHFSTEELEFFPHLSCIQLAFNRLKIPWQDAKIISVHGRELEELIPLFKQGVDKIAILTDDNNNPPAIARLYLSLDLPSHYDFWIGEDLGDATEKISHYSPQDLSKQPDHLFSALNVVILIRNTVDQLSLIDLENLPLFGLSDHLFLSFPDRPGLMTKREIRLTILGELALEKQQIIWDIGAGTGSVSIEIARLSPNSTIYAIEKTAMGITLINQNCQRFQVSNVIPVSGKAPDILTELPQPHRIFIGGSGGHIYTILEICQAKLRENGMIVMALATLENLALSLDWFKVHPWDYQVLEMLISRSVAVNNLTRFSPLNPVMLIKATKKSLR